MIKRIERKPILEEEFLLSLGLVDPLDAVDDVDDGVVGVEVAGSLEHMSAVLSSNM